MNKNIIIGLIVLVAIAAGIYYFLMKAGIQNIDWITGRITFRDKSGKTQQVNSLASDSQYYSSGNYNEATYTVNGYTITTLYSPDDSSLQVVRLYDPQGKIIDERFR